MKSFASVMLAASILGCFCRSAPACPVATGVVAVESAVVQAVPAPIVAAAPVVVQQTPVVVQSLPVVTTLAVPTVSVVAVPTVIEQVVKVKAKRHFRTPVRNLLFR